jgi:hypothetical protein
MKKYLASFYSPDLKRSAIRFKLQAEKMQVYDEIFLFNKDDLDEDFTNYVDDLLKKGKKRGYGHWVWQTFIHKHVLSKMKEGDIYHWCDIGCHFNHKGIDRLKEYIEIVSSEKKGFLGFSYKKPAFSSELKGYSFPANFDYQYTKTDLIKYFELSISDEIIQTPQVWGGSFFIKKNEYSTKLMEEHFYITRYRYDLIDDDEKKFKENKHKGFIEHRHSQSVLSILAKKNDCRLLSAYESEWALDATGQRTFEHLENFPIIAKRDKRKNIFGRFIDRQKKNLNRRYNKIKKFLNS